VQPKLIGKLEPAQGEGGDAGEAARPAGHFVPLQQDGVQHEIQAEGRHGQIMSRQAECRDTDEQGDQGDEDCNQQHGRPGRKTKSGRADG